MASGALCFFFFCKCTFQGNESRKGLLCVRQVPLLPRLCGACWEHAGMQGCRKGCGEGWKGYGKAKGCPSRCLSLLLWKGLFSWPCPEVRSMEWIFADCQRSLQIWAFSELKLSLKKPQNQHNNKQTNRKREKKNEKEKAPNKEPSTHLHSSVSSSVFIAGIHQNFHSEARSNSYWTADVELPFLLCSHRFAVHWLYLLLAMAPC